MTPASQILPPARSGRFSHHAAGISGKLTRATDRALLFGAAYLVASDAAAGVYRYALAAAHLTAIIYLPLIVIAGTIIVSIIVHLRSEASALGLGAVLVGLFLSVLLSLLVGRSLPEVIFLLYSALPLLLGLMIGHRKLFGSVFKVLALFFFITAAGVIANKFMTFPWTGATYEIGGAELGMSRQWSTGGVARLAGFSRGSPAAASYLLLGYIAYLRFDRNLLRIAISYLVGLVAIYWTTSKTQLFVMLLMPLLFLVTRRGGSHLRKARYFLSLLFMLVMVGLPLTSYVLSANGTLDMARGRNVDSSFLDRIANTWPDAVDLLAKDRSLVEWIFGRGLGGIGAAQKLFDPYNYNSADNLAVYLFVTWGFLSVLLLLFLLRKTLSFARAQDAAGTSLWLFAVSAIGCGATTAATETPSIALILGIICSAKLSRTSHFLGAAPLNGPKREAQPAT